MLRGIFILQIFDFSTDNKKLLVRRAVHRIMEHRLCLLKGSKRMEKDSLIALRDSGEVLRSLIERPEGISAFGVYDAMSAKIAELAEVECIYAGGYSAAGARGLPDMGILTLSEVVEHMKKISEAVTVPVVADIDDGYGGVHNVRRAVSEILSLKHIAAVHLEDQKLPKRCGHIAGKEVVSIPDFMPKLVMALRARDEIAPHKLVIARTDAFSAAGGKKDAWGGDTEESVKRGIAYAEAGADVAWCEFPTPSLATAREFSGRMRKHTEVPLGFNISPSFYYDAWEKSDIKNDGMLNALGYKFRFSTYPALQIAMHAVLELAEMFKVNPIAAMRTLKKTVTGTLVEPVNDVIGVQKYLALETNLDPKAKDKVNESDGYK